MPNQFDPPSGTRDFLAAEFTRRERAFGVLRSVFASYGFEPLQTPAFERVDVLLGKYGDEADKLVFKILRRGEHEASGEADLALRYDMTVPLARVAAAYGSQLPTPYKRYAMGSVWRADRPGRGRFREFTQCDIDTLGSTSPLADAEVLCAHHDAVAALGLADFRILINSRRVLSGLLEVFAVSRELGPGVLTALDKLEKMSAGEVISELTSRGLDEQTGGELVAAMTAEDATERIRTALKPSGSGMAGLEELDRLLALVGSQIPPERIRFTPRMVRGLSYYTGPIWELLLPDEAGARPGLLDVVVTVLSDDLAAPSFAFAAQARAAGLRASVYLGSSGKLSKQLRWAAEQGARWCLIYGNAEREAGTVTVRDLVSAEQEAVPAAEVADYLASRTADARG